MCSSSCSYEIRVHKDDIMHYCRFFIEKSLGNGEPSTTSACCKYVRRVNVVEICPAFTEDDKARIELWKWVKVTRNCGNALATGHNCASYVVQPPAS
ncbi:hypothetical protein HU200_020680 [Digitaria exilis]|uniref:Bifunctional inhibitor/plant lipid transfer protein/seed storage helical domain-containing protein n=1 Tax=Digitaria exilis TaxID=1010633 RepID=A0A835KGD7_9POAL|nr:hypothetical protein HU200_020680 [Digitaria exilis]